MGKTRTKGQRATPKAIGQTRNFVKLLGEYVALKTDDEKIEFLEKCGRSVRRAIIRAAGKHNP